MHNIPTVYKSFKKCSAQISIGKPSTCRMRRKISLHPPKGAKTEKETELCEQAFLYPGWDQGTLSITPLSESSRDPGCKFLRFKRTEMRARGRGKLSHDQEQRNFSLPWPSLTDLLHHRRRVPQPKISTKALADLGKPRRTRVFPWSNGPPMDGCEATNRQKYDKGRGEMGSVVEVYKSIDGRQNRPAT